MRGLVLAALLFSANWCAYAQSTLIQHVVIIVKENRSFDHMFGTLPGVNGATSGKIKNGNVIPLSHAPDKSPDFSHFWRDSLASIDGGKMDGFNLEKGCAKYGCYSQYKCSDIPNYCSYVQNYLLADNFFSSISSSTFPNHQYLIASQSNGVRDNPNPGSYNNWGCDAPSNERVVVYDPKTKTKKKEYPCFDYSTLGDLLDAQQITWKYYAPPENTFGYQWSAYDVINHIRNGPDWQNNVFNVSQFVSDATNGKLPAVSWIVPPGADSEHPPTSISKGENWTVQQVNAVMQGPQWSSTAIFITWDDWGGFYDHVPPVTLDYFGAGIRVPLIVLSPYVVPGTVYHKTATFDSLLAFVEANWGLPSLTQRDAQANNLMDMFQFKSGPLAHATILPLRPVAPMSDEELKSIEHHIQYERREFGDEDGDDD